MPYGVSFAHAARATKKAREGCTSIQKAGEIGTLTIDLNLDLKAAGLRAGRAHRLRVLLFEAARWGWARDVLGG